MTLLLLLACAAVPDPESATGTTPPTCVGVDADDDGADACFDCDDGDASRFPAQVEACNGVDDNCDGAFLLGEAVDLAAGEVPDCGACATSGFAAAAAGVTGVALDDVLRTLTNGHTCDDYGEATEFMFLTLDNHDDSVTCVYTGRSTPVTDAKPDADDMNTEHTWPQSLGAEEEPAKCDLHHLYPTDSQANSMRSSYPFGVVTGAPTWSEGGSRLGPGSGGGTVFEPRDVHKGNVARSMAWFSMRYGLPIDADQLAAFRAWNVSDPVDEAEVARSQAIGAEQGAANPYVVCPALFAARYGE